MIGLRKLLGEIHRRSVWQVLGSYAVGAWLVLQFAETLSSLIGLPLWFGPVVIVILAAGLPLVLLTSVLQGGRARTQEGGLEEREGALRRLFTWRNALVAAAAVLLMFLAGTGGYMGMRVMGVGPVGTLVAKGVLEKEERLILANIENRTADPSLGETVTALFRIDLSQSPAVTVMAPARIAPVLARMERDPATALTFEVANEIALREGLKAVVAGEILPLGEGFVLSARLVSVGTGDVLVASRETASDVSEIPAAVDRLSARLRERIGESLRTIQGDPPLQQVTTRSLEALRSYAQAEQANDRGDYDRAISLLQSALAEDSAFSMAHRKLGIILENQNREQERSREALRRAYEGRNRLTERERYLAEAAYFTYVQRDGEAAMDAYETLLEKYPADGIALNNLAVAYGDLERWEDALGLYLRSIEEGGAPAVTFTNAIEVQHRLGMADSAQTTWERFAREFPDHPNVVLYRGRLASASFDYLEAEAHVRQLREEQRSEPLWYAQATLELANLLFTQGKMAEGIELLLEGYELQARYGWEILPQARPILDAQVDATRQLVFLENPAGALRALESVEDLVETLSPQEGDYLGLANLYADAGRPDRARALIKAWEAEMTEEVRSDPLFQFRFRLALGVVALAEERPLDALGEFRASRQALPACQLCALWEMGRAHQAAGQPDSATAIFEQYLSEPVLERVQTDAFNLWRVLLRLAELYEARGDNRRAVAYYSRFVELWQDADPLQQPRVERIRGVIGRLESQELPA
jgi:tetratricopeptide (TPR) repeat protein